MHTTNISSVNFKTNISLQHIYLNKELYAFPYCLANYAYISTNPKRYKYRKIQINMEDIIFTTI